MAESPKQASSPATSKQKDSLLDVDFGKDFLSSWKTMSMAESDAMDFDFGPIAKGKKKAFNFDKLDVDFTLDGDLDTISSFKVDMSDLDIASPPKRPGKSKDIPEESDCGNHQKKQERFSFPFHFNELDSFSFESSLKKEGKQSNKNLNSEETSSESKCHGFGTGSIDGISASEVGLTPKLPVSVAATTSKIETPVVGFGDMDPNTKNSLSNFERNDSGPLKLSTQKVEVAAEETRIFPENTTTSITQEKNQESHHQEKRTSPEPYAEETMQDPPVDSFSENESSQHTASDVQVETYSQATKVHSNAGGDQNDIFELVAGTGFNCENPAMANSPAQCIARSLSNDDERNKFGSDTNVSIGYAEGVEGAEGDSCSEDTPSISVSIEAMHDTSVNGDAQNENGKLRLATLSSGSSVGKVIQMKEKQTSISQSKYFKRSDEIESLSQQVPSTQVKLTMFGGERTCYGEQSSKDEGREGIDARDSPSQSKLVGISMQHSGEINKGEVVQEGSRSSVKGLNGHGSLEQTIKSTTQNYLNPRLLASGIVLSAKSSNDMLDEGRKHYSPKPGKSTLDLSSLKISSDIGAKPQPSRSTLDKEIKPLRNTVQSVEQQESTMSKIGLSVSTEKQIPSTSPLKRKAFQGLNADMLTLNPSKRLSPSATETRNSESSERGANEQVCSNKKPTDGIPYNDTNYHQTSTPDAPWEVNMTEVEIPLVLENDVNVEKADAYTKELERICNMLKKKHDEAKEVLVRAIVNNNKLLMLNHPIYEEKIRKVQKFAAELMSK